MNRRLRNKLSNYLLKKEIRNASRTTEVISFSKVRKIGILYDATNDHDYELMKNYVRQLMALSKDVVALGYFNKKELPNTRFMKLGLDFFTRKSLNWKMKPIHPIVNNFTTRDVDLLLVFNTERSIPLAHVANQVPAKFKIGLYDKHYSGMFDFMIKTESKPTLKQMLEQVSHYLNLIKNEKQPQI